MLGAQHHFDKKAKSWNGAQHHFDKIQEKMQKNLQDDFTPSRNFRLSKFFV